MIPARRVARMVLICATPGLTLSCSRGERAGDATTADTAMQKPAMEAMSHDSVHVTPSDSARSRAGGAGEPRSDAMAGMDHGTMAGMEQSGSTPSGKAGGHAGHGAATASAGARGGTQPDAAEHASMSGMDHSAMGSSGGRAQPRRTPQASGAGMAGMDHSGSVMRPQSQGATMANMEHATTPSRQAENVTDAQATTQLDALVRALLQDPQVRAAVQQDSALARRWSNDVVRRRFTGPAR